MTSTDEWNKRQAKDAIKRAKDRVGKGWSLLGPELQNALVCRELIGVVIGQAEETLAKNPALAEMESMIRCAFKILDPEGE